MKKIIVLCLVSSLFSIGLQAQVAAKDTTKTPVKEKESVPHQITVSGGYTHILASDFNQSNNEGVYIGLDYAWQLGGLKGKKPAVYLSIPLTYTYFINPTMQNASLRLFSYGWTIRHHLTVNTPVTPYIGYGLLLNQLFISNQTGSSMGHETLFELGANFKGKKVLPFVELDYSMIRHPSLGTSASGWVHTLTLKGGIKF